MTNIKRKYFFYQQVYFVSGYNYSPYVVTQLTSTSLTNRKNGYDLLFVSAVYCMCQLSNYFSI